MLFVGSGFPRYKVPEFFAIAPVLTSTLTLAPKSRRSVVFVQDLGCVTSIIKVHSRSGLAWSRPPADRGLSRPTSVFRTTISVCNILFRSVEIWQYEGQNLFWSKNRERPSRWPSMITKDTHISMCGSEFLTN